MRAECIEAVSQALGRSITQAEAQNIENRIVQAMRRVAAEDRQGWLAMSQGDRFMAAAERAAQDVAADAALKRRRVALTALRHDAMRNYLNGSAHTPVDALRRALAFYSDGRSGTISIESTAAAIRNESIGQMLDVFDVTRGKVLGLLTNQEGVVNLVRELRGQDSGSAEAKAAARSFQDVAERLRQRFNRAGGDIGRLEDWGMPQSHSQRLVALAGKERWTQDALSFADRERYVNPDGTLRVAEGFDTYRSLNVAARLGSAAITAITDVGTQALTAVYNGLPITQLFMNELRTLNPASAADRRQALRAGLGVQQFIGAVNRWGVDGLAQDAQVSGRIARYAQGAAAGVMKLSGMNALTGAGQQAFGTVMMDRLGTLSRISGRLEDIAAGTKGDDARLARRLRSYGISEAEFDVWRLAQPEDWRGMGDTVLTAESIYRLSDDALASVAAREQTTPAALRERAATRMMAVVEAETSMAVIEPGARERAAIYGRFGKDRGSLPTEIYRSALQFKSFPISMMMRHGARAMGQATGTGKAAYVAGLVGLTTVMGGIALQLSELASGRDPMDMTDPRFIGNAFMKGGALGIYGDFLFSDYTKFGGTLMGVFGGPIAGDVETLMKATMGNIQRSTEGKEASGAAAVQLLKGKIPFANLWYTKAATDRLIFNQLQELASPGYLRRMEQRARREFKQKYFASPDGRRLRAPDLGSAVGG